MSKLKDALEVAKGFSPANIVKGVTKETIGSVIGGAKDIITNVQNNRLTVEQGLQELDKLRLEAEKVADEQITNRWQADMNSDSWLSKNVRPLVLIYMVVCTTLLVFIDAGVLTFDVKNSWIDLLQLVLITVIGAYFGGRSFEKTKRK